MTDAIEVIDGRAAFVSARLDAWHGLGTVVPGDIPLEQFLPLAGLDNWNVTKVPLTVAVPNPNAPLSYDLVARPGRYMTVRMKDGKILGENVGAQYVPFQAEEILDLASFVVGGDHHLIPETGGSIHDGRWIFLTFRIDGAWNLQADPHVPYFVLLSSHDGTLSATGLGTAIRVLCANTANMALRGADTGRYRIPHRTRIEDRQDAMRDTLASAIDYLADLQVEADQMMHTPLTVRQFDLFLDGVFPIADTAPDRAVMFARRNRENVRATYDGSDQVGAFRGTAWGALQAVNIHELWDTQIKPGKRPAEVVRHERHIEALMSDGNALTEKARLVLAAI